MRLGWVTRRHLLVTAFTVSCGLFPALDDLGGDASTVVTDGGADGGSTDGAVDAIVNADAPLDTSPTAKCDGGLTACGTTCVDTTTSSTSCGSCGHDCLGGTCSAGKCQPVVLVAHGGNDVVVDKGEAYWVSTSNSYAARCTTANCSNTYVALAINRAGIDDVAVDATNVYWTENGGVGKCARAGCNQMPTALVSGQVTADGGVPGFDGIAVTSTTVFFAMGGAVLSCASSGCANAPSVATAVSADDFALDSTNLYGTTAATLWKCPANNCTNGTRSSIATGLSGAESVAVDSMYAYYSFGTGIGKCALSGCGTTPTILASGLVAASDVTVDATYVYWTDPMSNTVLRCAVGGCGNKPDTIATGQSSAKGIALDSAAVYWTTSAALVRLAK